MPDLDKERLNFLRRRFENASDPDANEDDKKLFLTAMLKSGEEFLDLCEQGLDREYVLTESYCEEYSDGSIKVEYYIRPRDEVEKPDEYSTVIDLPDLETVAEDHGWALDECSIEFFGEWTELVGGDERHEQIIILRTHASVVVENHAPVETVYESTLTLNGTKLDASEWSMYDDDDDDEDEDEDDEYDEEEEEDEGEEEEKSQ